MKKLLFILALLCGLGLQAQVVTQAEVQGTWKIIFVDNHEAKIDIEKGSWVIKDETPAVTYTSGNSFYEEMMASAKKIRFEFKDSTITSVNDGQRESKVFKLEVKDGKTYMGVENEEDVLWIYIKDGKMHYQDEKEGMQFVFAKAE
ncbi:hypothetical protein AM493_18450 [Flavobacterium akiainvivens]|uniref:Lipocalin-like domain-containing protein n=1 Tax=Flavobacterium akiainvivens TaxID=1202724 RepID=A0A0M9VJJ2_9FLAO|nr:hypothetical protein [Flavobacterium akiainvivens]KOS07812.1 hypothetical protein AM493_18450 [Flavobacterium akiainvivens]SFQ26857.1 hypothetical protein SAMN05444144_102272 [Flavobacterium akiainvivens]